MAKIFIEESTLSAIGNSIRAKTGKTDMISPLNMPTEIASIQSGGSNIDALIDRSITEISSSSIETIRDYVFYGCSNLITAAFSAVTSVGLYSFSKCSSLTTADFPVATSIGNNAFNGCTKLTTADFPAVSSIMPAAFYGCTNLITADFPVLTAVGASAFRDCSKLTTADFPIATSIEQYAFYSCSSLTTLVFPVAETIGNCAFQSCNNLTTADFPVATSIGNTVFAMCGLLTSLLLRNSSVCTLRNVNSFNNTPIQNGTGYIYVPSALVEQYQAATNWSTYASQFRALEDYTIDGTTTGDLDSTKTGT